MAVMRSVHLISIQSWTYLGCWVKQVLKITERMINQTFLLAKKSGPSNEVGVLLYLRKTTSSIVPSDCIK